MDAPRKPYSAGVLVSAPLSFNEAAVDAPRKLLPPSNTYPGRRASMRPRWMHRGNGLDFRVVVAQALASMRPRWMHRGNVVDTNCSFTVDCSFNEAAVDAPRKRFLYPLF